MMTDIVERLRNRKLNEDTFTIPLRHEAASEIEKLRAEIKELKTYKKIMSENRDHYWRLAFPNGEMDERFDPNWRERPPATDKE